MPARSYFRFASVIVALLVTALAGGGCLTPPTPDMFFDLFLEVQPDSGVKFTLPDTGQIKYRANDPFIKMEDITDVKQGTVDVPVGGGLPLVTTPCVFFYFDSVAQRQLQFTTSSDNFGKKIFLCASDATHTNQVIGVRPIDQTVANGPLFVFIALPDVHGNQKKFDDYVAQMKEAVDRVQKIKLRK